MKEGEPQTPPIIEKIPTPPQKDEDWEDDSEDISCDKGSHKERSLGNDEREHGHKEHWKKEDGEA